MKKNLILLLAILPVMTFAQLKTESLKKDLIGTWLITEIKINGIKSPDFDPNLHDVIILKENGIQITTDKANGYEQTGPWKLKDDKHIEIKDSSTREIQILEILSLEGNLLKVKISEDDTKIEMQLRKK